MKKLSDFNYHVWGNSAKPWLIFIHGLLGSYANWRRIIPSFEEDFHILAYDQRGHGQSFKPNSGYSPEDYASDLHFLMKDFGIPRASIVGHSMGGRTAFIFALTHQDCIEKLVVEDIGPQENPSANLELVKKLKKVPVPFSSKKEAKEYVFNQFGDPKLGSFIATNFITDQDGCVRWNVDLDNILATIQEGQGRPTWDELKALSCPTLLIRGDASDVLPSEEFDRMVKSNPLIKGVVIPKSGHWVHFDQPDLFICELSNFLRS